MHATFPFLVTTIEAFSSWTKLTQLQVLDGCIKSNTALSTNHPVGKLDLVLSIISDDFSGIFQLREFPLSLHIFVSKIHLETLVLAHLDNHQHYHHAVAVVVVLHPVLQQVQICNDRQVVALLDTTFLAPRSRFHILLDVLLRDVHLQRCIRTYHHQNRHQYQEVNPAQLQEFFL